MLKVVYIVTVVFSRAHFNKEKYALATEAVEES